MSLSSLKSKIGDIWVGLTPGQRRIVTLAVIFIGAALLFTFAAPDRKGKKVSSKESTYEFQQPDMAGEIMAEKLHDNLMAQRAQMNEMQQRMNQFENTLNRSEPNRRQAAPRPGKDSGRDISEGALMRELDKTIGKSDVVQGQEVPHAPAPQLIVPDQSTSVPSSELPKEQRPQENTRDKTSSRKQPAEDPGPPPRSLGVLSWSSPAPESEPAKPPKKAFYVPAPASFSVFLLNGLDAPTGSKAKSHPVPLALEVTDLSWLPNGFRQDIKGCFLLTEGIGELSTERVSVRGISISCISREGNLVIDQTIHGFVADSDGKAGLRGEVVNKAGKLLAEAMKIGFIEGLAQFFQFNSRSLSITDSGAVSSPKSNDLGNAFLGGTASGIGSALDKLATYYMDLADEIHPVIQIGATRTASFTVTKGTELVFDKQIRNTQEISDEL